MTAQKGSVVSLYGNEIESMSLYLAKSVVFFSYWYHFFRDFSLGYSDARPRETVESVARHVTRDFNQ